MTADSGGEPSGREARREPRLPVRVPAVLLVYRGRYEVTIVDLSNNGAMVTGEGAMPARGEEVVLARGGFEAVATVAWTSGPNAGLAFHRAIDAPAVVRRLREGTKLRVKH